MMDDSVYAYVKHIISLVDYFYKSSMWGKMNLLLHKLLDLTSQIRDDQSKELSHNFFCVY